MYVCVLWVYIWVYVVGGIYTIYNSNNTMLYIVVVCTVVYVCYMYVVCMYVVYALCVLLCHVVSTMGARKKGGGRGVLAQA